MQKTASETMKPPAASRAGGAYVSGQSCCPPRRSAGERCWWSAIPSGIALTGGMRPRGAPGPMIAPGLRSSRLRLRINGRGPNQGPHRAQPAPTSSAYKKNQKKEKPSPQPQKGRRERPAEAPRPEPRRSQTRAAGGSLWSTPYGVVHRGGPAR